MQIALAYLCVAQNLNLPLFLTIQCFFITGIRQEQAGSFAFPANRGIVRQPLAATETEGKFDVLVNVHGGGYTGQAGAIRHGVARALLQADNDYRPVLKAAGFLTRDPRMKERKKYGLKAARRAPQFSKR